jgi:hypothetical protein
MPCLLLVPDALNLGRGQFSTLMNALNRHVARMLDQSRGDTNGDAENRRAVDEKSTDATPSLRTPSMIGNA